MDKDRSLGSDRIITRQMAGQLPLLVWESGADGSYAYFNAEWQLFIGRGQPVPESAAKIKVPAGMPCLPELSGPRPVRFKRSYVLRRFDGSLRQIAEECVPQYTPDGTFSGYAGFGIELGEVTGPSATEEALQRENLGEELAATNEQLADANSQLNVANENLRESEESLARLNRELEQIVALRTRALGESEKAGQQLNEELAATNEELASANEELATINEELTSANEELNAMNEELAQSQREIEAREQLFRMIATNIPKSLILVIDKDQRLVAVEGDLKRMIGVDDKDLGEYVSKMWPLREGSGISPYDRLVAGEQFMEDHKGPSGEDLHVQFVPVTSNENQPYAGLVIALDISDIKQAEERSAKLAAIVTSSDDAIVSKTLEGIVTSWNASAERIFGYTEAEMIGQPILKIIPQDRQNEEPLILQRLRRGERVDHFDTKRVTKDGKVLDISLTISPIRDGQGRIIGASKIARDITEKKRDEQRKNDFIGMVSHELKTPLTSLTAIVQLLQSKLGDSDAFVSGRLKNANKQVKKMADLINGFLNISRLESGKMLIQKSHFLLNSVLQEAVDETSLTASDYKIELHCETAIEINADRDKIGSVVLNLLSNAVKYSPRSSTIEVHCRLENGNAEVSVRDYGIGIRPYDAERLFDRYYRVENADTRHISGFGIGLYLSAEIIRHHEGRIWVNSEPGKGSTFYFALPLK